MSNLDSFAQFSDSPVLILFSVFIAGIFTSFTPCVYPLTPIIVSIFSSNQTSKLRKRVASAFLYISGMVISYAFLGMLTAKLGVVFGSLLGHPAVVITLAVLMCILALNSLDIFQITLLGKLQNSANKLSSSSLFVMGALSGLIAAPCVGPVLAGILVLVAKTENVLWGGLLLTAYALGLSLIFLLLAIFSQSVSNLPKSGNWLFFFKFIMATALFVVALWLVSPHFDFIKFINQSIIGSFISDYAYFIVVIILLLALVIYRHEINLAKLPIALVLALTSYIIIFPAYDSNSKTSLNWLSESKTAISSASESNKISMIDVYADWCVACKKLEMYTFSDPRVQEALTDLVVARISYDNEGEFIEKYGIVGLPAILFIRPDGSEIPGSRIDGFLNAEEFLQHLKKIS